jgi:hypothetical protein
MLGGSRVSTDPSLVVSVYFLDHEYPLILLWWCLSIFWIMNIHWSFYGGVCLFSGSRVSTDPSMVVSVYFLDHEYPLILLWWCLSIFVICILSYIYLFEANIYTRWFIACYYMSGRWKLGYQKERIGIPCSQRLQLFGFPIFWLYRAWWKLFQ